MTSSFCHDFKLYNMLLIYFAMDWNFTVSSSIYIEEVHAWDLNYLPLADNFTYNTYIFPNNPPIEGIIF